MTQLTSRAALKEYVRQARLHPFVEPVFHHLIDTLALRDPDEEELAGEDYAPMTTGGAAGITGGTGTVLKSSVRTRVEGLITRKTTEIFIDLTGLSSSTTDLDIIGQGVAAAYLGRVLAAQQGTITNGRMTCLETPAGGVTDIDLYSAVEATGAFDAGIGTLDETALVTSGGAWAAGLSKPLAALPAANAYLYLTGGAAGTAAAYTAGMFLIELESVYPTP